MEEYLTEETYEYRDYKTAIEEMRRMMAERPCPMAFDIDDTIPGHVIVKVKTGEAR